MNSDARHKLATAVLIAGTAFIITLLGGVDVNKQRGRLLALGLLLVCWLTVGIAVITGTLSLRSVESTFYIFLGVLLAVGARILAGKRGKA